MLAKSQRNLSDSASGLRRPTVATRNTSPSPHRPEYVPTHFRAHSCLQDPWLWQPPSNQNPPASKHPRPMP